MNTNIVATADAPVEVDDNLERQYLEHLRQLRAERHGRAYDSRYCIEECPYRQPGRNSVIPACTTWGLCDDVVNGFERFSELRAEVKS